MSIQHFFAILKLNFPSALSECDVTVPHRAWNCAMDCANVATGILVEVAINNRVKWSGADALRVDGREFGGQMMMEWIKQKKQ